MYSKKEFLLAARARLQKSGGTKRFVYTRHSEYKMREYSLSRQKVEGVIRRPYRTETGIVPKTVAVMQPVSPKVVDGEMVWKQEVWVLYQKQSTNSRQQKTTERDDPLRYLSTGDRCLKIISAWRYPGVSPAGNPIHANILRELEEGDILEEYGNPF